MIFLNLDLDLDLELLYLNLDINMILVPKKLFSENEQFTNEYVCKENSMVITIIYMINEIGCYKKQFKGYPILGRS